MQFKKHSACILILLIALINNSFSQQSEEISGSSKTISVNENAAIADSLAEIADESGTISSQSGTISPQSGTISQGSATFRKSKSSLDSTVHYYAKDSIVFNLNTMKMHLEGEAKLDYKEQKLEAERITFNLNYSTLFARGKEDTIGSIVGFPKFHDAGETFVGKTIRYNFKTKKGNITRGETEMSEGFYFGKKIKRITEKDLFVKDGYYTTCDASHPHYYFGSPEMKVVAKNKVFLDPIIFYVEDMPMFAYPFGLFFPSKSGRQSGIIIPAFFFSGNRGVVFENLGVYLALSEYYDTQFNVDLYSKGGYLLKNHTRWKLRNKFSGNMDLQYGNTRFSPDEEFTENFSLTLNHNQNINPQSKLNVGLNFKTQDFNRKTKWDYQSTVEQNIRSNASYNYSFDNGSNFSISYQRNQNIITKEFDQTLPNFSYSLPNWRPFKSMISTGSSWNWLRDISVSYSGSGLHSENKRLQIESITEADTTYQDTSFQTTQRNYINHNPNISLSLPKIGYFNFRPSFNGRANNYFRRMTKTFDETDSTVDETFERGFFTEYSYSLGVNVNTRLFGILKPKIFNIDKITGVKAMRHTYQPSVGFSYTPDLSDPSHNFYDTYYDPRSGQEVQYSRFEKDGGGIAPRQMRNMLSYSDVHKFEMKVDQGDTLEDKNIELMTMNLSTGYNLAADSLRFSDINMSFRAPSLGFLNFSGRAGFTLYDDAQRINQTTGEPIRGSYTKIDEFLISNAKGLMRMTTFGLNLSTNFSSKGVQVGRPGQQKGEDTTEKEKTLGERFTQREQYTPHKVDYFGDSSPGYSNVAIPWDASISMSFNYSRPYSRGDITRRLDLNLRFGFQITPTLKIDANGRYDLVNKELQTPTVNIRKDLHCWELTATWYPVGYNQGFHLRFAAKAPQLSDLKLERRSGPLY